MCGIVGIVNGASSRGVNNSICRVIEQAIMCDSLRGDDSTGIYQVEAHKVYSHKSIASGWDFVKETGASGILRDIDTAFISVAHNRAATTGGVSTKTAHPFSMTDVNGNLLTGVHNGTLYGWDSAKFDVDSEWALSRIAEVGDAAFEEFYGAYAMVWFVNDKSDTIQLARNSERPLYVGYVKDSSRMLIASEPEMLAWLCKRNSVSLEPEVIDLRPNRRYSFDVNNPREFTSVALPIATRTTTTASSYASTYYGQRNYSTYDPATARSSLIGRLVKLLKREPAATTNLPVPMSTPVVGTASRRGVATASYVHEDEARLARIADVLDLEVAFLGEVYDEESRTLWGEAELDGETSRAVVRNVRPAMYTVIKDRAVVVAKIIGAYGQESNISGMKDMCFVLQLNPIPATAVTEAVEAVENAVARVRSGGSVH